jgi:hypothetical protein
VEHATIYLPYHLAVQLVSSDLELFLATNNRRVVEDVGMLMEQKSRDFKQADHNDGGEMPNTREGNV